VRFAQARTLAGRRLPGSHRRRTLPLVIAGLSVASLAAGCHAGGSSSAPTGNSAQITVAAIPGVDTAPLFIAKNDGAFARAGLKVTIKTYTSVAPELQALSKGTVQIAAGDYVDFFATVAKSSHPDLSIVADGYHAAPGVMEVLTYPGSRVTSPQDLVNRTVGTPEPQGIQVTSSGTPYSLETLATQSVLTNDGVDPSQVKWRPMATTALVHALQSHKVAAILVQEPYILKAESKLGAIAVLDSCTGATANLPLSGYFAANGYVAHNGAVLNTFRRVLSRAQESAAVPGPVRVQLASEKGMSMQTASLVTIGSYPGNLDAASLQRVADLMFNFEMINHALNVSGMIAH
jgi:NitT/TauT family transport system substrate-binding protein